MYTYRVEGMTCGHCAASVTREVTAVPGVDGVRVDLAARTIVVTAAGEPDEPAIADAVIAAGYTFAGAAR